MSAHSSGWATMARGDTTTVDGSTFTKSDVNYKYSTGIANGSTGRINLNVAHTHNVYVKSSDTETKPSNFTKKLWVRTN
jgi:FtsP/CotA-like multicopper oxidase with cupredoxin domain